MADTRKHKRAPVSLKVRFKSATVDEFIEQYAKDISRGGIFIKSKSPMSIGTLLKFEFQLKDESRLIHGVGRVVWKRDTNEADDTNPPGMGIKFIKMDPESRGLVNQIVDQRGGDTGAFDEGGADQGGGGKKKPFFPDLPPAQQPLPEDRTAVRHASEFLESALAGGEVGAEARAEADDARRRTEQIQRARGLMAGAPELSPPRHKATIQGLPPAQQSASSPVRHKKTIQGLAPPSAPPAAAAASEEEVESVIHAAEPADVGINAAELASAAMAAATPTDDLHVESAAERVARLEREIAESADDIDEAAAARDNGMDGDELDRELDSLPPVKESARPAPAHERESARPIKIEKEPARPRERDSARPPARQERPVRRPEPSVSEEPPSRVLPILIGLAAASVIGYLVYDNFIATEDEVPVIEIGDEGTPGDELGDELPPPTPDEGEGEGEGETAVVEGEGEGEGETAPPPAAMVGVQIDSTPAGARIRVGPTDSGTTPATVQLPVGQSVEIVVKADGYAEARQTVTATEGENAPIAFSLTRLPYVLAVETDPAGARVSALGQSATGGELTLTTAPTRAFAVVAMMPGRRRTVQTVEPSAFTEQDGAMRHRVRIALPVQRQPPVFVPMMEEPTGEMEEPPVMEEEPGMEAEPPPPVMEPPPPVMEPSMDEQAPPDNPFD